MARGGTDAAWEAYGAADPYFGVLSDDRFRAADRDGEARRAFFAAGERDVAAVFRVFAERPGGEPAPRRALDFGCGVGRLVIPLARRCEAVVGVDVSPSMLTEAARNCREAGVANVSFARSDDRLSALEGTFDFVHSYIVFQHVPPRRGEAIFRLLLDRLEPGGRGAVHFTFGRDASRLRHLVHAARGALPGVNGLVNLAQRRRWGYPFMQMHLYDPARLLRILHGAGCPDVHLSLTDHGGWLGAMLYFRKP
jgi:SAM-dependent methyltransferase